MALVAKDLAVRAVSVDYRIGLRLISQSNDIGSSSRAQYQGCGFGSLIRKYILHIVIGIIAPVGIRLDQFGGGNRVADRSFLVPACPIGYFLAIDIVLADDLVGSRSRRLMGSPNSQRKLFLKIIPFVSIRNKCSLHHCIVISEIVSTALRRCVVIIPEIQAIFAVNSQVA